MKRLNMLDLFKTIQMKTRNIIERVNTKLLSGLCALITFSIITSCTSDEQNAVEEVDNSRFVSLSVSTNESTSRIAFTDNAGSGISPTWEANDQITLFKSNGTQAGTLTVSTGVGTKSATFTGTINAAQGDVLTVCYPAATNTDQTYSVYKTDLTTGVSNKQTQVGNASTAHLKKYSAMEGAVLMGSGSVLPNVALGNTNTIFTIKMPKPVDFVAEDQNLNVLVVTFQDGSTNGIIYSLKLTGMTGWPTSNGNTLIAHLMINPVDITNKRIDFRLTTNNLDINNTFKGNITASKSYAAGKRYTATYTPVRRTYAVGDIYPNSSKAVGVVYEISEGGKKGKVVSLDETAVLWGPLATVTNATSATNGATNQATIEAISGFETNYPGFKWCKDKNSLLTKLVWYMPAKDEMTALYAVKAAVNTGLSKVTTSPFTILGSGVYWSSTESDGSNAWGVDFSNGVASQYSKTSANVRAVAAF